MKKPDKKSKKQSEFFGRMAEIIAICLLKLKGYKIIEWRKKTKLGEIDLVARRDNILAFIEVKYRKNLQNAQLSISSYQQNRIINAANNYTMNKLWAQKLQWRYDAILIAPWHLPKHIKDAFRPQSNF